MIGLYGVMDERDKDTIWTYEAESSEEAADLYFNGDPDLTGTVVRVWTLGRHPGAYVLTHDCSVKQISGPEKLKK